MGRRANGEATPYANKQTGRYEMFVELPPVDGKRRRKKVTGRNVTEVRAKAKAVREELARFGAVVNAVTTVAEMMTAWQETLGSEVGDGTRETYARSTRLYITPKLGPKRVAQLQPRDVTRWLNELESEGKSPATRKQARAILRRALRWAENEGIVTRNVAAIAPGPRGGNKEVQPLTLEEVRDLLAATEGWRHHAAVVLMLTCGLRRGETFGLMWRDLDLDADVPTLTVARQLQRREGAGNVLVPTKTAKSNRMVALPRMAVDALKARRRELNEERMALGAGKAGPGDLVFTTVYGTPVDMRNAARELAALADQAGVADVHFHRLRHTAVAVLLDAGVPLDAVSETVGHSSIRLTKDTYGKLLDTGRARVAAAMDGVLG